MASLLDRVNAERQRRSSDTTLTDRVNAELQRRQADSGVIGRVSNFLATNPIVRGLEEGATLGLSNEIDAGLQAGADYLKGLVSGENVDLTDQYGKRYNEIAQRTEAARRDSPYLFTGAEFLGGAAAGSGALKAGGDALLDYVPKLLRYPVAGAATGAVAGAGYAQPGERLRGAESGALLGAAAGTAAPLVTKGVATAARTALDAATPAAQHVAARKVAEALARDGILPPQAASAHMRSIGPEAMLADVGKNTRGLGRAVASTPGKANTLAERLLDQRQAGRNARSVSAIDAAFGTDDDYLATIDRVLSQRQAQAKPLYDAAYQVPIPVTGKLAELLDRPSVVSAWKRAQRLAADEGETIPTRAQAKAGAAVPTKVFDYVKRGLDDIVAHHTDDFGRVRGEQGHVAQGLRRELIGELDAANPLFKDARATWAGHTQAMDALKAGRGFLSDDSDLTARSIARLPAADKEMFRIGAARAVRDRLLGAPDGADAYKRLFGNEMLRGKLKAAFPNEQAFRAFQTRMSAEAKMHSTRQAVLGGSPTARILAEQSDLGLSPSLITNLVTGHKLGVVVDLLGTALGRKREIPEAVRNEIGKLLFNATPERVEQALRKARPWLTEDEVRQYGRALAAGAGAQAVPARDFHNQTVR